MKKRKPDSDVIVYSTPNSSCSETEPSSKSKKKKLDYTGQEDLSFRKQGIKKKTDISSRNGSKLKIEKSLSSSNGFGKINGNYFKTKKSKKKVKKELDCTNSSINDSLPENGTVIQQKTKKKEKKRIKNDAESGKKEMIGKNSKAEHNSKACQNEGNSLDDGKQILAWFINPIKVDEFFNNYWEKNPLHIERNSKNYFSSIMSLNDIKQALKQHNVYYTKNLDVTVYENGVRQTDNSVGRATVADVFDFYKNGRSVRMLNPQTFIKSVGLLTSSLQDYFGSFVGANTYLTPPNSQGFAPHYDDIEAFILQLEGEKHWKVYKPMSDEEVLPKYSSNDFVEDELSDPCLEIVLRPGDLLYLPRGYIHQGKCIEDKHSLHITISMYQQNTWGDLLEKVLTGALQEKMATDVDFRKGLPLNYLSHLGMVNSSLETNDRKTMLETLSTLLNKLIEDVPVDSAVDQMGKEFVISAMPPSIKDSEISRLPDGKTSEEIKSYFDKIRTTRDESFRVKLLRAHVLRLVSEDDGLHVYYCTANSKVNTTGDEYKFSVTMRQGEWIDAIVTSYPQYIPLVDLPNVNTSKKWSSLVDLIYSMWKKDLLLVDPAIVAE